MHQLPLKNKEEKKTPAVTSAKEKVTLEATHQRRSSFTPPWVMAFKVLQEVVEEQRKQTEALEKDILAIEGAFIKNTPNELKVRVNIAKETFRTVRSSGLALRASTDKLLKSLESPEVFSLTSPANTPKLARRNGRVAQSIKIGQTYSAQTQKR